MNINDENEEIYRAIVERANDGIIILQDGKIKFINPALSNISGYESEELIEQDFMILIPDEVKMDIINNYKKRMSGEELFNLYESVMLHKSGKKVPVEVNGGVIQYKGKIADLVFLRDISERRKTMEIIKENEAKYQFIVENTDDILWLMDGDFKLEYVSPSVYNFLGYTVEEHLNHSLNDYLSPASVHLIEEEFRQGLINLMKKEYDKLRNKAEIEVEFIRKDRSRGFARIVMIMIRDENYKIKKIRGITTDITLHKQADIALQESNALLEAIVENVPLMIFLKEAGELRFVLFNRAGENLLGYERKNLIGKNDYDIFPKEQADFFISEDRKAIESESDIVEIKEEPINTAKQELKWLHTRKVSIRGADGKTKYLLGISEDITERRRVEEEIKMKNEQLLAINMQKDKFFSIIAHDLKSPFSGFLKLTGQMIKKLPEMNREQVGEFLKIINESAGTLGRLLENLLEWSKMQQGLIDFKQEKLLLTEVVNEAIEPLAIYIKEKSINLQSELPDDLYTFVDRRMVASVFRNIVSNAVKFTRHGGSVFITAKNVQENYLEVKIKDNGIGMNMNLIENLFRLDGNVMRPGTDGEVSSGLGLILCKEFVEKNGGKIWVESKAEQGSTFSFTIPVCK